MEVPFAGWATAPTGCTITYEAQYLSNTLTTTSSPFRFDASIPELYIYTTDAITYAIGAHAI